MKTICKSFLTLLFFNIFQYASAQQNGKKLTLSDELFTQAYDSTKIKKIPGHFSKATLENKRYLRIRVNKKTLRGYLMAFNTHGLFIANKDNTGLTYCDYKNINSIYFGRSYGNWVATATAGVAGITMLATLGSGEPSYSVAFGIIAGFVTATYGQLGIALGYGLYKGLNHCHWNINYKRSEGIEVSKYIDEHISKFGNIQNVTLITNSSNPIESSKDSTSEVNENVISSSEPTPTQPSIKVEPAKSKVSFLEGLNFEKGNAVSIQWMLKNFDSKSVNESVLMKSFKNIKGLQIMPDQLLALNNSSLQFLAIIIGESAGYDIKSIVELTDKQKKEIIFYEPSIIDAVHIQSTIDKSYLSEIDLQNLQVLFNELKNR